jgi:sialate O-acetylesterase
MHALPSWRPWTMVYPWTVLLLPSLTAVPALADIRPHQLFTDHAVLQQGMPVPVWGFADGDEQVTVKFQGQEVSTTAQGGRWKVELQPLQPGGPFELVIAGEKNTVTLPDVLVGEVWLASGQSNMQWPINASADPEATIAGAANDKIRLFTVPRRPATEPENDVQSDTPGEAQWQLCTPETVPGFSAVAYHFGRDLQQHLGVPVGLISTNYGGTLAEAWTSREALSASPELAPYAAATVDPNNPNSPTGLYNAMIHPLVPCAIRGAIWYQGESNALSGRAYQYRTLFPAMIADWRNAFGQEFPFLFVQLAPWRPKVAEPGESDWAELCESQRLTALSVPKTAMAVITDLGDEADIHPKQKAPVGARLALAARGVAYGEDIHYTGPVYDSLSISGDKAIVSFKNTAGGLVAKDGNLTGFAICGEDRKWVNATATIEGDTVVVSSPAVPTPVAVRFGWANFPVVNLFSAQGLPASPFRTDDFPLTSQSH